MPWADKEREREMRKKWRNEHPEKVREYHQKWLDKPGNRERQKAACLKWNKENPERIRMAQAKHYAADPARRRGTWMDSYHRNKHKKYGMTLEQYEAKVAGQNGLCAICGEPPLRPHPGILCVDHDHETGQTRDLLCTTCNIAIGAAKESRDLLHKMIQYIEKWKT